MRLLLLLLPLGALADTVTLKDGTFLRGHIERVVDGVLELRAPSLGLAVPLRLPLEQIESFVTEEAVAVSAGGVVSKGAASAVAGQVVTRGGTEVVALDRAMELWRDPAMRPSETTALRQWVTQADADVSGDRKSVV